MAKSQAEDEFSKVTVVRYQNSAFAPGGFQHFSIGKSTGVVMGDGCHVVTQGGKPRGKPVLDALVEQEPQTARRL